MRETNCRGSVAIRRVSNAPYASEYYIRFELIDETVHRFVYLPFS